MKPFFKVFYNYVKLSLKKIKSKNIIFSKLEMLSYNTKLNFKKDSVVYLGKKIVSDGPNTIFVDNGANLSIGNSVYFNQNTIISCKKNITIGNKCLFGPNVKIYDNNHVFNAKNGVSYKHSCGIVKIGNNCWIASNVVILKNADIGNNCVIGAGCIIDRKIPDCSIVKQSNNLIIKSMD